MLSSSYKLPLLAFTICFSTLVVANKPYAPDLWEKASLADDVLVGRQVSASRPYAPDLYARNAADPIQVLKRSTPNTSDASSSWSFNLLAKRSEEEMHSRGMLQDDLFTRRGQCGDDSECGNKYYCSTKKHFCYKKLHEGKHCTRDAACKSSYCSNKSNTCESKKSTGSKCHGNDSACSSGYCSPRTSTCKPAARHGESCVCDSGCEGSMSCVNQKCHRSSGWVGGHNGKGNGHNDGGHSKGNGGDHHDGGHGKGNGGDNHDHGHGHGGSPSKPPHPSPSGSPHDKRSLHFAL